MAPAAPTADNVSIVNSILDTLREDPDSLSKLVEAQGRVAAPRAPRPVKAPAAKKAAGTPDSEVTRPNGEVYFTRSLGEYTDVHVLRECRSADLAVLLYGQPGTGKTALIEAAYAPLSTTGDQPVVYTVQGHGDTEFADFVGGYVQLPSGKFEWVDGPLLRAMETGSPLYVDEIALIDPKALAGLYGVMDGRRELRVTANPERGVVKAKDGFYVVAACNPNAPGSRMSEALVSRFTVQFEVTTDYALARRMGVPSRVVTAAQNLSKKQSEGEVSWAPQLRELLAFKKTLNVFGQAIALGNLVAVAPEMDRPVVADVLTRAHGETVKALAL
jgi:nitric oxide reductase NorQ protein